MQSAAKIARRVASVVGVGAGLLVILASVLSVNGNAAAVAKKLGSRGGTVETLALLPGHWAHEYGLTGPGTWALILGAGAVFALPWLRKRRNLAPIVLVVAVALEGLHVARLGVPMLDSEPVYARPWTATVVGDGPIIREPGDMAPWAVEKTGLEAIDPAVQRIESELMIENRPQLWSVEEVDGYETKVLLPRDLMELLKLSGHSVDAPALSGDAGRKRAVVLGLLGTKYLVGRAETKLDAPGFTAVALHDVAKVWRVDYAQPVARVCGVTRFAGDGAEARRLTAGGWPGLTRAAVVEAPEEIQKVVARDGEGTATVVRALPGYWHVQVVTPLGGMLVIADRAYPGWHAYLDGTAAWWGRAYGTLKCMAVPPGTHDAMMVYRPGSVLVGLWAATVGVALMAAMAVLALWPRRLTKGAS